MVGVRAGFVVSKLALLLLDGVRSFSLSEDDDSRSSRMGTVVVTVVYRVAEVCGRGSRDSRGSNS
jgi:hypothetical protein